MPLPKSTYYYEIQKDDKVSLRNQEVEAKIKEIFYVNKGRYGVRRVHKELINQGYVINHKRVQRMMNKLGLK